LGWLGSGCPLAVSPHAILFRKWQAIGDSQWPLAVNAAVAVRWGEVVGMG